MPQTVTGTFETRRGAELAVEHLVQEYGIDRSDIFVAPVADANSAGTRASGADVESGHPQTDASGDPALDGALIVSVDMNEDELDAVETAFTDAGATHVTKG